MYSQDAEHSLDIVLSLLLSAKAELKQGLGPVGARKAKIMTKPDEQASERTTATSEGKVKSFLSTAEGVVKVAGLFAAFGYLSLRSHLNFLGVSSQESLGIERYLMECYQIFASVCYSPDLLAVIILACLLIAFVRSRSLLQSAVARKIYASERWKMFYEGDLPPFLLLVGSAFLFVRELQLLTRTGFGVLIGPLSRAVGCTEIRKTGSNLFLFVLLFCSLTLAFYLHRPHTKSFRVRMTWNVMGIASLLLALQLPVLYGVFVRPTVYTQVQIQHEGHPAVCGVMILNANDRLVVWRTSHGRGWMQSLPSKELQINALGTVDVLEEADRSARSLEEKPSCVDISQ